MINRVARFWVSAEVGLRCWVPSQPRAIRRLRSSSSAQSWFH